MKYFMACSSLSADIHTLLPIKNNRIVAASNKSSLGMSECGLNMICCCCHGCCYWAATAGCCVSLELHIF